MSETDYIILGLVVLIAVIDTYLAIKKGAAATISEALHRASLQHPIIPFLMGLLAGHVFFPVKG